MTEYLLIDRNDGVSTITLNRPAACNALNWALIEALIAALADARHSSAVRAIVLTGAPPAFCDGLDRNDFSWPAASRHRVTELIRSIPALGIPFIAAVNGAACTAGLEIALACEFIIAGAGARFTDTRARLPDAVGAGWTRERTCLPIDAATALRIGLVDEVVPDDCVVTRARALAATISGPDPELPAWANSVIDRGGAAALTKSIEIKHDKFPAGKERRAPAGQGGRRNTFRRRFAAAREPLGGFRLPNGVPWWTYPGVKEHVNDAG